MKITFTQYDLACMMGLEIDYDNNSIESNEIRFLFHGATLVELDECYDYGNDTPYDRVGKRVMEMVGKAAAKLMVEGDK